jgi:hypothetical protein
VWLAKHKGVAKHHLPETFHIVLVNLSQLILFEVVYVNPVFVFQITLIQNLYETGSPI